MTLRIGMIGPGRMGQAHIERLHTVVAGARVTAVSDVRPEQAQAVAEKVGAKAHATSADLIADPEVDAVMVTSHGPAHKPDVVAAIEAGKRVLSEKPLAPSADECREIMDAEAKAGKRLVTVGFMRRVDASYRQMKEALTSGDIGDALMVHCAHRNPTVPDFYTWDMAINDTAIHEIDAMRWLLDEEFVRARVDVPRATSRRAREDLKDPIVLILETQSGVRVDDEIFVNCQYGYDIRCELVGELGTVTLGDQEKVSRRSAHGLSHRIPMSDNERFAPAFVTELQEWVDAVVAGRDFGPTSWDGYAAASVCDAGLRAVTSGEWADVTMIERPALYA